MKLNPGDQVILEGTSVVREIVDVRPTGYGWKYPDLGQLMATGSENYFWSENSTDPHFENGWELASRRKELSPPTDPRGPPAA